MESLQTIFLPLWHTIEELLPSRQAGITAATSFMLIFAAEIGDKSQLVCMTLASKYRPAPVLLGAGAAFMVLNMLAVAFGLALSKWLPPYVVAGTVALLFGLFGWQAVTAKASGNGDDLAKTKSSGNIFLTTFVMITLAEFGDKTQLAVAALSSSGQPYAIWSGATLALILTSAIGIVLGRTLLKKLPLTLIHKISGLLFLVLATLAAYKAAKLLPTGWMQ